MQDDVEHGLLDAFDAVRRNEHLDARLVLAAEALGADRDLELVARHDARVDDGRRVVLRVLAVEQRLGDDGLPEIPFRIALGDTGVDRLFEIAACDVQILTDLKEDDRHAGVLTDGAILGLGDLRIADDLVEHVAPYRRLLCLASALQSLVDVVRQIVGSLFAHLGNGFRNLFRFDCTQDKPSHKKL